MNIKYIEIEWVMQQTLLLRVLQPRNGKYLIKKHIITLIIFRQTFLVGMVNKYL